MRTSFLDRLASLGLLASALHSWCFSTGAQGQAVPAELRRWMVPQHWIRDSGSTGSVRERVFRLGLATSDDGRRFRKQADGPVFEFGHGRRSILAPALLRSAEGRVLREDGSYWRQQPGKTALGFAVSLDGRKWYKNPHDPVFTPDPSRPWESHYTTSQSVLRLADGGWRIWYASRKKPPFVNKYFAIGTATWDGMVFSHE